ncbi:MAG: NAD(P)-binding protein, partial [Gemmatimonadales bacterium]
MPEPRVVILGAGPAGAGAAYQLRRRGRGAVTVIEQQLVPGGNSGSFEAEGQRLDFGSHRLHPACDPAILADIRTLLAGDLLDRPR